MSTKPPTPPGDLAERGLQFWRDVTKTYALRVDELELLAEACRCLDRLDALRAAVDADGLTITTSRGVVLHPAAKEERQVRLLLRLVLAQLDLPDVSSGETNATKRGRLAAHSRWQATG